MPAHPEKIALYVHMPFCTAKCPYCAFYSVPVKDKDVGRLVHAELNELDMYAVQKGNFKTIYIGGGSPSCIPGQHLHFLINELIARTGPVEEFTIEVNPLQVSPPQLENLLALGVNRLSIGAQSFNQPQLDFLGRPYTPEIIVQLVNDARSAGFKNISLDLIFAIPGQALGDWKLTLDLAVALGIEHISAYSLTYEKNTPLYNRLEAGSVQPLEEETDLQMFYTTLDTLHDAGIEQYEISNYARPGFECRHNLAYWLGERFLGIGPAAASFYNGAITTNIADVDAFIDAIEKGRFNYSESERPGEVDYACQLAVLNLRLRHGIDIARFKKQTGFDFFELFADALREITQRRGWLVITPDRVFLTRQALAFADTVTSYFASV
jgi:oxygen-independent coproporphyrinogen-3 oxidase